jgi:hypothetical protein
LEILDFSSYVAYIRILKIFIPIMQDVEKTPLNQRIIHVILHPREDFSVKSTGAVSSGIVDRCAGRVKHRTGGFYWKYYEGE